MDAEQIHQWLCCTDSRLLEALWQQADRVRRQHVGDAVHLRGLLEISNDCRRLCGYCGIRAANTELQRYLMSQDEILQCARSVERLGYGTLVLQAGESELLSSDWVADLIIRLKQETDLVITLSLGERSREELALWKHSGADRYLLRFETSNRSLFRKIHPSHENMPCDRIVLLETLRQLGYATGSGMLVGLPGQTCEDLTDDLLLLKQLNLHMIGIGPFVPDPATPLGQKLQTDKRTAQTSADSSALVYRVVALARILCPRTNIPSTTAVATLFGDEGQDLGLQRGANVLMPNVTPQHYRRLYAIYPRKDRAAGTDAEIARQIHQRIALLGRAVGRGRGDAPVSGPLLA